MLRYQRWIMVAVVCCVIGSGCQKEQVKEEPGLKPAEAAATAQIPDEAKPAVQPQVSPKNEGTPPIASNSPEIKVENASHDFGVVGPDSMNKCQFKFSNVGKSVLKINQVLSTCGCTVPELDKKEYAPGESGVIDVTFRAPTYAGSTVKHLYIVSNDPANPRAELVIYASVEIKVVSEPNKIELILNKDNAGMSPIKIKSLDGEPFAITSFTATGQSMTVEFDPKAKATEHTITPKVDIAKLQEVNVGVMQIGVDHSKAKEVLISYNAIPAFELRPPRIVLQNVEPGVITSREVWIVNNYGQAFEIESIESRNGYMKSVNQKKDGVNIGLDIEITPPKQDGPARRYITDELTIKIKSGPVLTVRCSGWYKLK